MVKTNNLDPLKLNVKTDQVGEEFRPIIPPTLHMNPILLALGISTRLATSFWGEGYALTTIIEPRRLLLITTVTIIHVGLTCLLLTANTAILC